MTHVQAAPNAVAFGMAIELINFVKHMVNCSWNDTIELLYLSTPLIRTRTELTNIAHRGECLAPIGDTLREK